MKKTGIELRAEKAPKQVSESTYEQGLKREVKKMGGWAIKIWPFNLVGFPDRLVLMPGGLVYFVELKAPGKTPRDTQQLVLSRLASLGFKTFVVNSEPTLVELLTELKTDQLLR